MGASEHDASMPPEASVDIEELARLQGAEIVETPEDLVEDIWGPEELEAFLADLRASRDACCWTGSMTCRSSAQPSTLSHSLPKHSGNRRSGAGSER